MALAIVLTGGILLLERHISIHRSLVVFYFVPIALATWFTGPFAGVLIALANISGIFLADVHSIRHLYYQPIFFYLNVTARACFMFFAVFLLTHLKTTMREKQKLLELSKKLNEKLQRADEQKNAFVANVSHELKGPLGVIREAMSLILDKFAGEVSEQQKEILSIGKRSTERLIRLVSDLLDLAHIEAGKMELEKKEINVGALVEEVLKLYGAEISKKQLILQKEIDPNAGNVVGDRDKLTEVIINLLNNAIKYTPKGSITVKLAGNAQEVRFEIVDTGPGIPEEYFEKIFDKFERIMTEKQEGTGLGLPIAKDIIELHKGKLWVESEAGKGSKFIFTLPRFSSIDPPNLKR